MDSAKRLELVRMARRAARRFAEPKKMYANALDGDDFQAVIFAKLVKARESVQRAKVENETYYLWTDRKSVV